MATMATKTDIPVKSEARRVRPLFDWSNAAWEPLSRLRDQVDQLIENFPGRASVLPALRSSIEKIVPAIDVTEQDDQFKLTAELPGIEPKAINVSMSDGMLCISGEKAQQREEKEKDYSYCERSYGSFQRTMSLPASVDPNKISANYDKGVLTVILPKSEKSRASERKIEVKQT